MWYKCSSLIPIDQAYTVDSVTKLITSAYHLNHFSYIQRIQSVHMNIFSIVTLCIENGKFFLNDMLSYPLNEHLIKQCWWGIANCLIINLIDK